jgi:hypothetical protein
MRDRKHKGAPSSLIGQMAVADKKAGDFMEEIRRGLEEVTPRCSICAESKPAPKLQSAPFAVPPRAAIVDRYCAHGFMGSTAPRAALASGTDLC